MHVEGEATVQQFFGSILIKINLFAVVIEITFSVECLFPKRSCIIECRARKPK